MPPDRAASRPAGRVAWLAALVLVVLSVHLWALDEAGQWSALAASPAPARLEVAFVRELQPQTPAPVAPRAAVRAVPTARAGPATAASPPGPPASAPAAQESPAVAQPDAPAVPAGIEPPDAPLAAAGPAPVAEAASQAGPVAAAPPASAAPSTVEQWPPSTRLSYRLEGHYRGPVEGQAEVEWLRVGSRYQVHMEVSVGPAFAPLMSRRVSSEGEITQDGLRPQRYDEVTRMLLRDPRRLTVLLGEDRVRLAQGREELRPAGVQDSASQFVQLTWLFNTRPDLLQPGQRIELPLALPRHLEPWSYEVLGSEPLATPAGWVEAWHVKPRREARPGGDLTAEFWVAPSLQYLPVRILIRQDAETYLDLQLSRLPLQSAPGR